jgi:cytochrome P450
MSLPPGPSGLYRTLVAYTFSRDRLRFIQDLTARYGDVVYFEAGGSKFAILNHPGYVRDVLVTNHRLFHKGVGLERAKLLLGDGLLTSEDDLHLRQRRLLMPAFHRDRIAGYARTMAAHAQRAADRWRAGDVRDVAQDMAALTLAVAGKTLFDAEMEGDAGEIGAALSSALAGFNLSLMPYGEYLVRLPLPPAIRFHRARARLDRVVYRLIAQRQARLAAGGTPGDDVLSMLVAARDDEGDGTGMSDQQIRDEAMTLLLAGHETTANAMTWTWYLLSQHPQVEQALHREIDSVLGERVADADDLPRLPYTRAVLAESMRLFPPAYLVGRRALIEYPVPATRYVLPARTVVLLAQYMLHRDPRFWTDPERFQPERWIGQAEGGAARHRFAYFPFGSGPRVCIGEHFAWMEGTLLLATIAKRWKLRLVPGHRVQPQPIITLRARYGMRMTVEPRDT